MDSENVVYKIITNSDDDKQLTQLEDIPEINYAVAGVSIFLIIMVIAICWCMVWCIRRWCRRENFYEPPPVLIEFDQIESVRPPPPPPQPPIPDTKSAIGHARSLPNELMAEIRGAYKKRMASKCSYDLEG